MTTDLFWDPLIAGNIISNFFFSHGSNHIKMTDVLLGCLRNLFPSRQTAAGTNGIDGKFVLKICLADDQKG